MRPGLVGPFVLLPVLLAIVVVVSCAGAAPAFAAEPWWHLTSGSRPTELPPGGEGTMVVQAVNLGDESTNGGLSSVSITDTLPAPGVKVYEEEFEG